MVVPIAHIEKTGTFVSARAFVGYGSGEGIELLPLARSLTNDLKTADLVHAASTVLNANLFPTTFVPSSYTKGGGSLNVAQTIKPFLALQASVSVSAVSQSGTQTDRTIGSSVAVDALEGRESVSAAASFDAGPLGFPVATMAEYSLSSGRLRPSPPGSTELAHLVAFGIYYSGSRTLQMGLGAATQVRMMQVLVYDEAGKPRASDRPLFLLGQILLRHDF